MSTTKIRLFLLSLLLCVSAASAQTGGLPASGASQTDNQPTLGYMVDYPNWVDKDLNPATFLGNHGLAYTDAAGSITIDNDFITDGHGNITVVSCTGCGGGGGSSNATSIQSIPVSATAPIGNQGLFYDGSTQYLPGWADANLDPTAASGDNGCMYTNAAGAITEDGNCTLDGSGNLTLTGTAFITGPATGSTVALSIVAQAATGFGIGVEIITSLNNNIPLAIGNVYVNSSVPAAIFDNNSNTSPTVTITNTASGAVALRLSGSLAFGGGLGATALTATSTAADTVAVVTTSGGIGSNNNCIAGDGSGGVVDSGSPCATGSTDAISIQGIPVDPTAPTTQGQGLFYDGSSTYDIGFADANLDPSSIEGSNSCVYSNASGAITSDVICTLDGSGNLVTNSLYSTTTVTAASLILGNIGGSSYPGSILLLAGYTQPTAVSGSIILSAATTQTTEFVLDFPPAPPSGSGKALICSSGTPVTCSWTTAAPLTSLTAGTNIGVSGSTINLAVSGAAGTLAQLTGTGGLIGTSTPSVTGMTLGSAGLSLSGGGNIYSTSSTYSGEVYAVMSLTLGSITNTTNCIQGDGHGGIVSSSTSCGSSVSFPITAAEGGTNTATTPTSAQILIAQNTTTYAPESLSGDCTLTTAGVINCTESGGTLLTSLFAPITGSLVYAPLASPALTGSPTAPTQTTSDTSTDLATDAFVYNVVASYAPLASPTFTGTPAAPTATAGTNSTQVATTAYVVANFASLTSGAVAVGIGGLGNSTTPASGKILIGQSASSYLPETMSGDCTITLTGAINCLETNGAAFTSAATTALTGGGVSIPTLTSSTTTNGDAVKFNSTTGELADAGGAGAILSASNTFSNSAGQFLCALTNSTAAPTGCIEMSNSSYQTWAFGVRGYSINFYNVTLASDDLTVTGSGLYLGSTESVGWGTSTNSYANFSTPDTKVSRKAAGEVSIDTTAQGNGLGKLLVTAIIPGTLYKASGGTALPSCASALQGELAVVSDATSPTYMGSYTGGGGITASVICSYNGSTYAWLTH
jgi:hypothetical protein